MNECHDEVTGKFCEVHGGIHTKSGKLYVPKKGFGDLVAEKRAEKKTAEITHKAEANEWGFTPSELQAEREAIIKQFKKGGQTFWTNGSAFNDRVDAETRAQAVAQGRIANKGEIKRGRNKAVSANWAGLIALGLIVT